MANNALTTLTNLSKAELAYKCLRGVFCIYKPPELDLTSLVQTLKKTIVGGINKLPGKPVESVVKIDDDTNNIYLDKNLADTKEALGATYVRKDFRIRFIHPLDQYDSGVLIGGINDEIDLLYKVEKMRLMRVYQIKAKLGVCTEDFTQRGRFLGRSDYHHVNRSKIDRLMSTIQASYQREMYKYFGVDVQSQEAFELASKGLLRPMTTATPPQIYSIRCIDFDRPYFTLEVYCINESTVFLRNLIHDCGLRLKTNAVCVQTRRVRDGFVDADKCLGFNEWTFEKIQDNVTSLTQEAVEFVRDNDKQIIISSTSTNS